MQSFVEIIVVSIAMILLIGEVVVILNVYKVSNPAKYFFRKGKEITWEMSYEEKNFLLRDLELQKELAERKERKLEIGEIIGSIDECRERKYLLQTLIDKINTTPSNSINETKNPANFDQYQKLV
jgi:hypothetical protein